jgi:hypothetical protein
MVTVWKMPPAYTVYLRILYHSQNKQPAIIFLNIDKLLHVMVKCCVFFEVRVEILNIAWKGFGL